MAQDWICAKAKCGATTKKNKWATTKAQDKGWFFLKDGRCYCPEHLPEWVKKWRIRQETINRKKIEDLTNG